MASNLSARVRRIECALSMLGEMRERLAYLQPTMGGLVHALCDMERYRLLEFLPACRLRMNAGEPFPLAWKGAVADDRGLEGEERALLAGLGEVLGATDLESQLSALDCTRELLQTRLETARTYCTQHARLYRTMGVLCGMALVIILM